LTLQFSNHSWHKYLLSTTEDTNIIRLHVGAWGCGQSLLTSLHNIKLLPSCFSVFPQSFLSHTSNKYKILSTNFIIVLSFPSRMLKRFQGFHQCINLFNYRFSLQSYDVLNTKCAIFPGFTELKIADSGHNITLDNIVSLHYSVNMKLVFRQDNGFYHLEFSHSSYLTSATHIFIS